jgi:large subunit ribosomal protein L19
MAGSSSYVRLRRIRLEQAANAMTVKVKEGDRTRVQAYEGVCIGRSGGGLNESFTVRKISYGEGVERVFPLYSPMIESVELLRRARTRRAKLYFIRRKAAHDVKRAMRRSIAVDQRGKSTDTKNAVPVIVEASQKEEVAAE